MVKAIPGILTQIVEHKRFELARDEPGRQSLRQRAEASIHSRRDFTAALLSRGPAIIAEIKQASPSRGILVQRFDPALIAAAYELGGAAALSVLTDEKYFQGSLEHLEEARAAVHLPVLRKDFTIDPRQITEAAANGADAILLIAAILSDSEMRDLREHAEEFRLTALVEVHNEEEVDRAIASGARVVGVNNRDLGTFEVNVEVSLRLAEIIPPTVIRVAESGIRTRQDILHLQAAGYQGFLIGEHLMTSADPASALRALLA